MLVRPLVVLCLVATVLLAAPPPPPATWPQASLPATGPSPFWTAGVALLAFGLLTHRVRAS